VSTAAAPLQSLFELTNRLTAALDTEEVARVVVDGIRASVGASTASVWIVDEPDATLRHEAVFSVPRVELPLIAHGRAIGGLSLVVPQTRELDVNERMFLTVLAHHAALALERSQLLEREQRTRKRLELLQQLTVALSSAATVDEVATLATRLVVDELGLEVGALWATDDRGDLRLLSAHGMTIESRARFAHIPFDSVLPAARVARDRSATWCETERDLESEDPSVVAVMTQRGSINSYGALPLVHDDRVLGVLTFSAGRPRHFSPEDRAILTSMAAPCAVALARARLHDNARSAEQLLQSVLEHLPVGVVVSRPPDSTLVLSNPAVLRMWRIADLPTRGEDRCKVMNATYPDGRAMPMSESPVVRALRGEVVDGLDARIERSDGSVGSIRASAAPVRRKDGSVEVAVATFVDTTAEKVAQAAAAEAGRAKDEFLAMLGHELRNPLTPIVTALNLMDLAGDEAFRTERTIISRQVRHVVRLVDDLLDISRITRGAVSLQKARVEVAQAIASAIEAATPLFEQRAQYLSTSVPAQGLPVLVDPGRLGQAVANLLTNASKYTEPGGSISITAARDQQDVCIRVRDTGIGIEPDVLPKVFDLFSQAKSSLDRSEGGLGIGLAIVRSLVELNGGSVSAHSAGIGRGSEFVIRLPLDSSSDAALVNVESRPAAKASVNQWRVLVVDDNRQIAHGLAAILDALGCVPRVAYDGPSAIGAVATFDADLALVDIGLPGLDGHALARHFRSTPATSAMRLVAVTGYGEASDKQRSLEAGFDEHIVKPIELDTLRGVLSRIKPATVT
jgi:signal transduction histidine kinase/ActR/RegA family two-component response regulator/uncharacterized protein YigA (DUF484 family)